MNYNQLKTFIMVAEKESFSAAAVESHLTQPAISFQIQALENYFGTKLFDRRGRSVKLNEAGKILYRHAQAIIKHFEDAEMEINAIHGQMRGHLVIGASTIPGEYILPAVVGQFKQEYPEIKITLEISDTDEIVKRLVGQDIDLGVIGSEAKHPQLEATKLGVDEIVLIVPPGHELATSEKVTLQALKKQHFIWRESGSGTRRAVEKWLNSKGVDPIDLKVIMELGSTEAIITAVEAGLGVAFVPRVAVEKTAQLGRVACVKVKGMNIMRDLYLIVRKRRTPVPVIDHFCRFLLEQAGKRKND